MKRSLVEVGCPNCGAIVVPASSVVCATSEADHAALCALDCPTCGRPLFRPLETTDVSTLFLFGAHPAEGSLPFELLESHSGPALSWDEALDFHFELAHTCCPQDFLSRGRAA
jgi:endogenous inhibitor of DNA gyrase (YacG/DUF329 family)